MIDKESILLLQKLDCNCNDCVFMERDFDKFKKWEEWNKDMQLTDFEKQKNKAISEAKAVMDSATSDALLKSGQGMLRVAEKMKFQFDRDSLLSYGNCAKLNKAVAFIPAICQIETQDCFKHRRES